jgi:hypothetical protein
VLKLRIRYIFRGGSNVEASFLCIAWRRGHTFSLFGLNDSSLFAGILDGFISENVGGCQVEPTLVLFNALMVFDNQLEARHRASTVTVHLKSE